MLPLVSPLIQPQIPDWQLLGCLQNPVFLLPFPGGTDSQGLVRFLNIFCDSTVTHMAFQLFLHSLPGTGKSSSQHSCRHSSCTQQLHVGLCVAGIELRVVLPLSELAGPISASPGRGRQEHDVCSLTLFASLGTDTGFK